MTSESIRALLEAPVQNAELAKYLADIRDENGIAFQSTQNDEKYLQLVKALHEKLLTVNTAVGSPVSMKDTLLQTFWAMCSQKVFLYRYIDTDLIPASQRSKECEELQLRFCDIAVRYMQSLEANEQSAWSDADQKREDKLIGFTKDYCERIEQAETQKSEELAHRAQDSVARQEARRLKAALHQDVNIVRSMLLNLRDEHDVARLRDALDALPPWQMDVKRPPYLTPELFNDLVEQAAELEEHTGSLLQYARFTAAGDIPYTRNNNRMVMNYISQCRALDDAIETAVREHYPIPQQALNSKLKNLMEENREFSVVTIMAFSALELMQDIRALHRGQDLGRCG